MPRPRTPIGTFGEIYYEKVAGGRYRAFARFRDHDGQLRRVQATGPSQQAAARKLKAVLAERADQTVGQGELTGSSSFKHLVEIWLEDLDLEGKVAESTRALYERNMEKGTGLLGEAVSTALPWAIALGLVLGKILGISAAVWLAVRFGLGRLPQGVGAWHVPAVGAVAGIGFTVSLFIADLAYDDPALTESAKVGIFAGSLLAGVIGAALMIAAGRRPSGTLAVATDVSTPDR